MAFVAKLSPSGRPWAELLRQTPPTVDAGGFLSGPWGECMLAAAVYEHETPLWDNDPDYRDDGPGGQVIEFLHQCGHRRLERAADKLENATERALRSRGGLQPGPGKPEVWEQHLRAAAAAPVAPAAAPAAAGPPPPQQERGNERRDGSSSGSSGSSGSSSGSEADPSELLAPFGLREPLPWQCYMNEAVEEAPKELPPEVLARLPAGLRVERSEKVSDGWHEGYLLHLSGPLVPGQPPKAVLRIWRSQLAYWRLEVPTGAAVEMRAMALAREAGVPTAGCADPGNGGLTGVCHRAPRGEACDWAIYNFVENAGEKEASRAVKTVIGKETDFMVWTMARLHSHSLEGVDTEPLPRFEGWRDHVAYLAELAAASGHADAVRAVEAVTTSLEAHQVPELPPALCHFDWHLGNALVDGNAELQALIDWEFAGVGDPRLDVARFCRHEGWTGDGSRCREHSDRDTTGIWSEYAKARFGPGADALARLGPPEPWIAMECTQVLVMCAAVCGRAASLQQEGEQGRTEVPRCGLLEWVEDLETAKWHLRRIGLL